MNTNKVAVKRTRAVVVLACIAVVLFLCRPFYLREVQMALMSAVSRGTAQDVERLLWLGADANGRPIGPSEPGADSSPIHDAVQRGDPEIVRVLLAHGTRIKRPGAGSNPVLVAARGGHAATVRLLLDHGVRMEKTLVIIRLLLEGGADPNVRTLQDVSPLREADHRSAELAKLLREHGARK